MLNDLFRKNIYTSKIFQFLRLTITFYLNAAGRPIEPGGHCQAKKVFAGPVRVTMVEPDSDAA
jgi:hypothetical protein